MFNIIRFFEMPNLQEISAIEELSAKIIYRSELMPLVGVICHNPEKIAALSFVRHVRRSRTGVFEGGEMCSALAFQPPLNRLPLQKNAMFGWGNIKIFVLDSGINDVKVMEQKVFNGSVQQDLRNHGTVVAKIIKYFARGAVIYSGKIGDYLANEIALMQAIEWAVENKATIINIAAGFEWDNSCNGTCELCELVNIAAGMGIGVVTAAGTNSKKTGAIKCPGLAAKGITVGAIDENQEIFPYSCLGSPNGTKPDLVAPGKLFLNQVESAVTSYAVPIVSGVLGAVVSRVGSISKACEYIYRNADDLGLPRHLQGCGCINIERAVKAIIK